MPGALASPNDAPASTYHDFSPASWVPLFRPHTPRTRFITLPADFLSSELTGAVYLADPSAQSDPLNLTPRQTEIEWSDGTVDTITAPVAPNDSHGVHADIERVIGTLGGSVCPKFGLKCPIDATWATFHRSTKCTTPDDVLTLLKSSERVMSHMKPGEPTTLALRQWADMDDRTEFRVFIRNKTPVGVCPRVTESSVEYSAEDMDEIVSCISTWYVEIVREAYDGPQDYVLDVYKDRRSRVWIIDFAAWGTETDCLLFTWEQLVDAVWMPTQSRAQFRCAYRHAVIRPSPRMYDGLPVELRNSDGLASLAEAAQRLTRAEGADADDNE